MALNRGALEGEQLNELNLPSNHERGPLGHGGGGRHKTLTYQEHVWEEDDPGKVREREQSLIARRQVEKLLLTSRMVTKISKNSLDIGLPWFNSRREKWNLEMRELRTNQARKLWAPSMRSSKSPSIIYLRWGSMMFWNTKLEEMRSGVKVFIWFTRREREGEQSFSFSLSELGAGMQLKSNRESNAIWERDKTNNLKVLIKKESIFDIISYWISWPREDLLNIEDPGAGLDLPLALINKFGNGNDGPQRLLKGGIGLSPFRAELEQLLSNIHQKKMKIWKYGWTDKLVQWGGVDTAGCAGSA